MKKVVLLPAIAGQLVAQQGPTIPDTVIAERDV